MTSNTVAQSRSRRNVETLFAGILLLLSIGAMLLQELPGCGSCRVKPGPLTLIAPAGAIGYTILVGLAWFQVRRWTDFGSALAAGIHTVLAAILVVSGRSCPLCITAAITAGAFFATVLIRRGAPHAILAATFLGTLLLGSVPFSLALINGTGAKDAHAFSIERRPGVPLDICVYEQDHCGYCRDFRDFFAPRLATDFGESVRLRFLDARSTAWVRHTPTIVVPGGPIFEGLPTHYAELRSAIAAALIPRK